MAFERIGDIYRRGEGVRKDDQKALDFYKEGAKKGNYFCFAGMTMIFIANGHLDNARKALRKMLTGGESDNWSRYLDCPNRHIMLIESILFHSSYSPGGIDIELISVADAHLPKVLDYISESFANNQEMSTGVRERKNQLVSTINAWGNRRPSPPPKLP
jgi:hypothetical protein